MSVAEFQGQYRFLSNFWRVPVELDGEIYPSVEHAYQAAKTVVASEREAIRCTVKSGDAKRAGRKVTLRPDWEQVKDDVMLNLLRQKFAAGILRANLLATDGDLVEGNYWGDTYWGVCNGRGQNKLGRMLMQVREELRKR